MKPSSNAFSLNSIDYAHIGRHFLYSALAAGIGYILTSVVPTLNVTGAAAIVLPIFVTGLTTIQSYLAGYNK